MALTLYRIVEDPKIASDAPHSLKRVGVEGLDHYPRLQGKTTCEEKEKWRTRQRQTD
jgi:hypothetical protein